jgi:hypothetical protein
MEYREGVLDEAKLEIRKVEVERGEGPRFILTGRAVQADKRG